MADEIHMGGCQCGAVRFRVEGKLGDASVCHCRMCQKGERQFLPAARFRTRAKLVWTRGDASASGLRMWFGAASAATAERR